MHALDGINRFEAHGGTRPHIVIEGRVYWQGEQIWQDVIDYVQTDTGKLEWQRHAQTWGGSVFTWITPVVSNDGLIAQYKAALENKRAAFDAFGPRSQENYDATTPILALEPEIARRGLTKLAGLLYANVWD